MRILSGVDIVEINRIQTSIAKYGEKFLKKIFTKNELVYCEGRVESLAVRFAAKEAGMKLLGSCPHTMSWLDLEIVSDETGAPEMVFHQAAKMNCENIGLFDCSISLSHSETTAIAMIVGLAQIS